MSRNKGVISTSLSQTPHFIKNIPRFFDSTFSPINLYFLLLYAHICTRHLAVQIRPLMRKAAPGLDEARPARPPNKHHEPQLALRAPSWTPSMAGTHALRRHTSPSGLACMLHSVAQLRKRVPRQVKPLTCLWESGPRWWSVCSCTSMGLNPIGGCYFSFPPHAWAHKEMDTHTHSQVWKIEGRCSCCQKNIK